jgi:dipeptidyl aminopeptidase/acylaminoacyl peptidase
LVLPPREEFQRLLEARPELLNYTLPPTEKLYSANEEGKEIERLFSPFPDEPVSITQPMKEWPELILPAVDRLIEEGIADPNRLGLMGHRYGGYAVNCILTQTDRFRAAVSIAGVSDLVSDYLSKEMPGSVLWYGKGPEGREQTLWGEQDRFIENSPVLYLDRVTTPLLLMRSDPDSDTMMDQAKAMYVGLRRLEKPVSMVSYLRPKEVAMDGGLRGDSSDSWGRILEWFGRYL